MSKIPQLERQVHGRERDLSNPEELQFGVHQEVLYARNRPGIEGAQWTGIVTQVSAGCWLAGWLGGGWLGWPAGRRRLACLIEWHACGGCGWGCLLISARFSWLLALRTCLSP